MTDINESRAQADALRARLAGSMHFALPGIVQSYDSDTQTANILPAVHDHLRDGTPVAYPLLHSVPVFLPVATDITWSISPGDSCLVIFADTCVDEWFSGTAPTETSTRRHSLSDAFAFIGFRPLESTATNNSSLGSPSGGAGAARRLRGTPVLGSPSGGAVASGD